MENVPRILILGGGFGGVMAARKLGKAFGHGKAHITLIDRNSAHVFVPLLYEVSTAFIEHGSVGTAHLFRSGIAFGFPSMLSRWGVDFVQAEIIGLDWDSREVRLEGRAALPFDYVIIGLGAETNYYGIEGLKENAYTMKTIDCADRLRQAVHDYLHRTETGEEERMDVVIGGAGATGVELAAELTLFIRKHLAKGHLEAKDFRICIVEAQSRPLPVMDECFSSWARERLQSLGVKLHLDSCIQKVEGDKVTLTPRPLRDGETPDQLVCDFRTEKQKQISTDLVVWTGGIKGASVLSSFGIALDARGGRIPVGPDLRVVDRKGAYAVGDSVLLIDPSTGHPVPWLAQAAMEQGEVAASNVIADVKGSKGVKVTFHKFPVIVTMGGKWGLASVGKLRFRGMKVWLLREAADLRYFMKLLPFWRALAVLWRGIKVYSKND